MSWQPIETAPTDETWVLVTGGVREFDCRSGPMAVVFWTESPNGDFGWAYAFYDSDWRGFYEMPTHWMPLPEPPDAQ